ncbi:MAG: PhoH-like ATPase, partial [Solirubrobacterales bacterium]|nr:PhoH-like ATPase [Solirubrobacterales bacterium]
EDLSLSGLELFDQRLGQLDEALTQLLDLSGIHYEDINTNSSGLVVMAWNPRRWNKLPPEAAPRVGAARKALRELRDLSSNAARHASDRAEELAALEENLEALIEQPNTSNGAPKTKIEEIRDYASKGIEEYRSVIRNLPSAHGTGERLLVADTSALLDRADLQDWKLDGGPWTVVFFPQVLSELDDRKRDPRTRDAAQKVINQLEDLDRRGDLFSGVSVAGKISAREIPTSPDMNETLSWLRSDVPDDAMIAGALDLLWQDLTSRIAVTASDRNVRNKARLAGLKTIRPSNL